MENDEGGVDVDEDIYGDLESDIFLESAKRPRMDDVTQQVEYQNLLKEHLTLKCTVKKLQKENRTYASNISSLYLTAKNEIDKKNFIIKNLTGKLKQLTTSKSNLSKGETEEIIVKCQEALQESEAQVTINEIKNCLKRAYPDSPGMRKRIKFGNMSLYFFREQGSFQREEAVDFPKTTSDVVQSIIADTEESPENTKCSHTEAKEPNPNLRKKRLEETSDIKQNNLKDRPHPPPLINISCLHGMQEPNGNEYKGLSSSPHEPEPKRQRISEKQVNKLEHDSERHANNKRRSSERQNNSNKHSKTRDYSPSNDRHRHKRGDDSNNTRGSRNYGSVKSENSRQHSSWRNQESRPAPTRRLITDTKYSKSTNPKHRSRSKSK